MAKYEINYACGHGKHTDQLYGKESERKRRIEWAERTMVCPDCYKAKMRAKEQSEPRTATIIYNAFSGGVWLAVTTGDTYSIKDQLKAAGCQWREYQQNADILGMSAPRKSWMLYVAKSPEGGEVALTAAAAKLAALGITINPVDGSPLATISYEVANRLNAPKEVANA